MHVGRRADDGQGRSARWRPHPPARTIRLRLTLTYGAVFLVTAAALLTIGYLLVRHNLNQRPDYRDEARRLGLGPLPGPSRRPPAFGSDSAFRTVFAEARAQLISDALHRLLLEYIGALVLMTAVSVAAGWLLAGRALAPLRRITSTARRVSGENLGERISLQGPPDELKELADTFDGMLARLDSAFASQRHFVANASHELRTPLAIMRAEVDVALADPNAGRDDLRAMGEAVRETIDRSEGLIEALLMLARSEAITARDQPVDVTELVGVCVTDRRTRAAAAQVSIRTDLQPALTRGEPNLLERMIVNLVDNAILHNVPHGFVEVTTRTDGDHAVLVVRNGGEVIAPAQAAGLAEPFRRLHRGIEGFGLGLSIVRSLVEAHRGSMAIEAPPEGGLVVAVRLPADRAARLPDAAAGRRARFLTKS